MNKSKLIRITTVPISLDKLLSGQLNFMNSFYDVIAVSSDDEYLTKIGKKEHVATFHLEMSRKITPIQDVFAVLKLVFFLRKEKLPVPQLCSECRHERRISDRLKLYLYDRTCMCAGATDETGIYKNTVTHIHGGEHCAEKFKTGYNPEGDEIVYCEKCYQQEVY